MLQKLRTEIRRKTKGSGNYLGLRVLEAGTLVTVKVVGSNRSAVLAAPPGNLHHPAFARTAVRKKPALARTAIRKSIGTALAS